MVLRIISIENVLFNGVVDSVTFPGMEGSFTVLDNHAPLVSLLQKGTIVYQEKGARKELEIEGGMVDVQNNHVAVMLY